MKNRQLEPSERTTIHSNWKDEEQMRNESESAKARNEREKHKKTKMQ